MPKKLAAMRCASSHTTRSHSFAASLPTSTANLPLEFGKLEAHGCFVGSHAVVVLSDRDDMRAVSLNLMRFFEDESCGQRTPCRVGTEAAPIRDTVRTSNPPGKYLPSCLGMDSPSNNFMLRAGKRLARLLEQTDRLGMGDGGVAVQEIGMPIPGLQMVEQDADRHSRTGEYRRAARYVGVAVDDRVRHVPCHALARRNDVP